MTAVILGEYRQHFSHCFLAACVDGQCALDKFSYPVAYHGRICPVAMGGKAGLFKRMVCGGSKVVDCIQQSAVEVEYNVTFHVVNQNG